MSEQRTIRWWFTCGRLLCREVRDLFGAAQTWDPDLRWHESSGWLERTFTVYGKESTVRHLMKQAERWRTEPAQQVEDPAP